MFVAFQLIISEPMHML